MLRMLDQFRFSILLYKTYVLNVVQTFTTINNLRLYHQNRCDQLRHGNKNLEPFLITIKWDVCEKQILCVYVPISLINLVKISFKCIWFFCSLYRHDIFYVVFRMDPFVLVLDLLSPKLFFCHSSYTTMEKHQSHPFIKDVGVSLFST